MYFLRVFLFLLLWPVPLLQGQELLLLTFSSRQPSENKTYNTEPALIISVSEGQTVMLQKSSGRDYRLSSSPQGWSWLQVEQTAIDASSIVVTPRLQGKKISLEIDYSNKERDEKLSYRGTVSGNIGQWISLLQPAGASGNHQAKTYTAGDKFMQLWVKVDKSV